MATLLVLNGRNEGEWYSIPKHRPLVCGREETLLAEILDARVSRRHMEVRYIAEDGGHYKVFDLYSRNGLEVNQDPVRGNRELHEDDVIQIGHTLMVFTLHDFDDDEDAQAFITEAQQRHDGYLADIDEREGRAHEKVEAGGGGVAARAFGFLFRRR